MSYSVGYGKPPKHSQFQKGTSGNPTGKRPGVLNLSTVLQNALQKQVVVWEEGKKKTVSKMEAAVKRLVDKAITGDMSAFRLLSDLARLLEGPGTPNAQELEAADQKVLESLMARFGRG